MGTRVSLTLLALAHLSIMSREASWIGFLMYPTLISRSWAKLGLLAASTAPAATAMATAPFSNMRPRLRNRPCIVGVPPDGARRGAEREIIGGVPRHRC